MNAEVKAEIVVAGFSKDYSNFLEYLSGLDILYKSDYFQSPVKFNMCFNDNILSLKHIFSLSNNTIKIVILFLIENQLAMLLYLKSFR